MFGYCVDQEIEEEFYRYLTQHGHAGWPEQTLYRECNQAFTATMRDLLRPVFVRDVPINCYGRIEDAEVEKLPDSVERSYMAGYGIPFAIVSSEERFQQFCDAVLTLGYGSYEAGVENMTEDCRHNQVL